MKIIDAVVVIALLVGMPVQAQAQTLADIMSQLDARTSELEQVDALLADADPNRRFAAMDLLMKSGNPAFVERATQVGIFSSDEELKRAALRAVFDGGGPFKLLINYAGSTEEQNGIKAWVNDFQGSWDDGAKIGTFIFRTSRFDEQSQCWKFLDGQHPSNCAFTMVGSTISINGWSSAAGTFELNEAGQLVGMFRSTRYSRHIQVPATIPIVE